MKKVVLIILIFITYFENSYSQAGWFQQYYSQSFANNSNNVFFINSQTGWLSFNTYGYSYIYKTTNGGTNWNPLDSPRVKISSVCFINPLTGWAGSGDRSDSQLGKIFKTTNGGNNWVVQSYPINETPVNDKNIYSIKFINENTGYACGSIQYLTGQTLVVDTYVLKTTNSGVNWTVQLRILMGEYGEWFRKIDLVDANNVWVVGKSDLFYRTTNGGVNWIQKITSYSSNYYDVKFLNQSTGFALYSDGGSYNGWPCKILKSTNAGNNFNTICSTNVFKLRSFSFIDENNGWMCGDSNTLMKTTNSGANWIVQTTPLFSNYNNIYFYNISTGWAFDFGGHIIKTITGGTTSAANVSEVAPSAYSLGQNYPNPFNPITNIKFSIVNAVDVKVVVYDVQGRGVQTLVNERLNAGSYEVKFDGSSLNSGVYFYKLSAGDFTETKRMILIK